MSDMALRAAPAIQVRRLLSIALQLGLVVLSNRLAFWLRFDGDVPHRANEAFWLTLPWLVAIRALTFIPFRLYEGLWQHTSIYDARAIAGGICASSLIFFCPHSDAARARILPAVDLHRRRLGIDAAPRWRSHDPETFRRVVSGQADQGRLDIRCGPCRRAHRSRHEAQPGHSYHPIGFVDDDPSKSGIASTACRCSERARTCREDPYAMASRRSAACAPAPGAGGDSLHRPTAGAIQGRHQDAAEPSGSHRW